MNNTSFLIPHNISKNIFDLTLMDCVFSVQENGQGGIHDIPTNEERGVGTDFNQRNYIG